jgi:hypothetical protein
MRALIEVTAPADGDGGPARSTAWSRNGRADDPSRVPYRLPVNIGHIGTTPPAVSPAWPR